VIKSLIVILNFVYTKKFLKDVIAGYSGGEVLGKVKKGQVTCVMEDVGTLRMWKETFFRMMDTCKQAYTDLTSPSP